MKTKKVVKRLSLSKETVSNLDEKGKRVVGGGYPETWEQSICWCTGFTCVGCVSDVCTNTCNCNTDTCFTCAPEPCR
jgi:hypothetical protein